MKIIKDVFYNTETIYLAKVDYWWSHRKVSMKCIWI